MPLPGDAAGTAHSGYLVLASNALQALAWHRGPKARRSAASHPHPGWPWLLSPGSRLSRPSGTNSAARRSLERYRDRTGTRCEVTEGSRRNPRNLTAREAGAIFPPSSGPPGHFAEDSQVDCRRRALRLYRTGELSFSMPVWPCSWNYQTSQKGAVPKSQPAAVAGSASVTSRRLRPSCLPANGHQRLSSSTSSVQVCHWPPAPSIL